MKKYNKLFNKNGYVLLKNVLSNKQKHSLLKYVNEIENSSKIKNNYIHKYELDSNNKSVLCRIEYIIKNNFEINNFLTKVKIPNIIQSIYDILYYYIKKNKL